MKTQEQVAEVKKAVNGYKVSRLMSAAERLGFFAALTKEPQSITELSEKLNLAAENLVVILNALVSLGFVERVSKKDQYFLGEYYEALSTDSPNNQLGYIRHATTMEDKWAYLAEAAKNKELTLKNFNDITGNQKASTVSFIQAMHANALPQARYISDIFDFNNHNILDVGAGAGTYSIAVGQKYGAATGILFDLPAVAEIISENLVQNNLADRFTIKPGDYNETLPEGKFDDIFLFAVAHQEESTHLKSLLREIYAHLKEGGRLFLSSFFLNADKISPEFSVMFALEMLVMSTSGKVYTHDEICEMISSVGFLNIQRDDKMPGPSTLYTATK